MNIKRNFLQNLALAGLAVLSAYLPAGEAEEPRAEIIPLEAKAEKSKIPEPFERPKAEPAQQFKQPILEDIISPEIGKVECHGKDKDDIIIIPMRHTYVTDEEIYETKEIKAIGRKVKETAIKIYDNDLADILILEGTTPESAKIYADGQKMRIGTHDNIVTDFNNSISAMMNARPWIMPGLKAEENVKSSSEYLDLLNSKHVLFVALTIKEWLKREWLKSPETFEPNREKALKELEKCINNYAKELKDYFKNKDPQGIKLYNVLVKNRDEGFVDTAINELRKGRKGAIIVAGAWHEQGIREYLQKQLFSYNVVRFPEVSPYEERPQKERIAGVRMAHATLTDKIKIRFADKKNELVLKTNLQENSDFREYVYPGTAFQKQ